jgi:high-affinity iron transporter
VVNQSPKVATVYLFRSDSGAIVATISNLAPGHSRGLTARVQAKQFYSWGCDLKGAPRHISDAEQVPNAGVLGGPGKQVIPVTNSELIGPLAAYRRYARRLIHKLERQAAALVRAATAHNRAAAERDWLTAHMTWLDIGQDDGAYGAFGDLGRQIDGTAEGLADGVHSPGFTGFHRIEFDLWTAHNLRAAAADARKLRALVAELAAANLTSELPGSTAGLLNFTLRIHEVLEDALRDSLSGNDNYGSDTDLASLTADVAATREFLGLFAPLLTPRSPYMVATARQQLKRLDRTLAHSRHGMSWVGIHGLGSRTREHVDGEADAVLETLAPAPDLLHIGAS